MQKLVSALALGGALSLALLSPRASADVITLGPASPITSSITGVGTISFTPTPATEILQVTNGTGGNDYSNNFPNQDPNTTVPAAIASLFSVPTPTLTLNDDGPLPTAYSQNVPLGYNYVAIHNDTGELLFFYDTSETMFTLNSAASLSNARFYACASGTPGCASGPPLVPEPSALALVGSALVIFGFVWRRRSV